MHRLLRRAALTVDGGRRNFFGPAGGQHGVASNVERLLTDLHDAAHDDVVNHGRVEAVALFEGLQHVCCEVDGVLILQLAVALATRGADGIDDHCFSHVVFFLCRGPLGAWHHVVLMC